LIKRPDDSITPTVGEQTQPGRRRKTSIQFLVQTGGLGDSADGAKRKRTRWTATNERQQLRQVALASQVVKWSFHQSEGAAESAGRFLGNVQMTEKEEERAGSRRRSFYGQRRPEKWQWL